MKLTFSWSTVGLTVVLLLLPKYGRAAPVNLLQQPFQSDYSVITDTGPSSCWLPGTIQMTTDSTGCHPLWVTPPDFGGQEFAAINGSMTANQTVFDWELNDLNPGETYTLNVKGANLCCRQFEGVTGSLDWLVNGVQVISQVFSGPGVMSEYDWSWVAVSNTLKITALGNSNIWTGADYAVQANLDSTAAPEPASILLLGSGLALGYRKYRHSTGRA